MESRWGFYRGEEERGESGTLIMVAPGWVWRTQHLHTRPFLFQPPLVSYKIDGRKRAVIALTETTTRDMGCVCV